MIDLGQSKSYIEGDSKQHVKNVENNIFEGNYFFSSKHVLGGQTQSRRDDVISIIYTLSFIATQEQAWIMKSTGDVTSMAECALVK